MYKDIVEFTDSMREMINIVKDKSLYHKTINMESKDALNLEFYEGQQNAYFHIMGAIIGHINADDNLSLEDFRLEDFDLIEIIK